MDEKKHTADGYRLPVVASGHNYALKNGLLQVNASSIALAVNTYDKMDNSTHTLGLYDLKLYEDDSVIHEYKVDRISFDYSRYVIAQVDYPVFLREGSRAFHKCFTEANNKMPASYYHVRNNGIIDSSDGKVHDIRIEVSDYNGNKSTLHSQVQYDPGATVFKEKHIAYSKVLTPYQENTFTAEGFNITIPGKTLLDSMFVNYTSIPSTAPSIFSNIHKIGDTRRTSYWGTLLSVSNLYDCHKG
jgi:hypothetical protein